jgi:hypothetical protein
VYFPVSPTDKAREDVLAHVVQTYFSGSTEQAVTALLRMGDARIDGAKLDQLRGKIRRTRQSERGQS